MTTLLTVDGIRKKYGPREVLRGVSMSVSAGEIKGLLGANGAGKSTLIGCLSGATRPSGGTITLGEETFTAMTPRISLEHGLAVIYQHFSLVPSLSVADNVFLGDEHVAKGIIDRRTQRREAGRILEQLGADFSPNARIEALSTGERQLVEIAKALRRNPKVMILDEPTAALGHEEAAALGARLKELRNTVELGIVYVSHLLHEVFDIADSVTILRDGEAVLDGSISQYTQREVISAIAPTYRSRDELGREFSEQAGEPALEVDALETAFVGPVDFATQTGKVTAIFGLMGSGRTEILETIYGVRKPSAGSISFRGKKIKFRTPTRAVNSGLAMLPAERKERGVFSTLSAKDNLLLASYKKIAAGPTRNFRREKREFGQTAESVHLVPPQPQALASSYSGGNQQKLVLGRWLTPSVGTELLLLDEPTQGIDIGARADIYKLVRKVCAEDGMSVLFATSDPDEVLDMADDVYVLYRGRIVFHSDVQGITVDDLLHAAHGTKAQREEDKVAV
jgi:ribose transport system ATP-binding protein